MSNSSKPHSHSADVRIHLELGGTAYPVAQLGPDFVILKEPAEYPSAKATLHLNIDGNLERWPVFLLKGLKRGMSRVPITLA